MKKISIICTVALATGFAAIRANADEWNKKTTITTNKPIQISDTYLEPGTYVMKLVDSDSDRHIVRIMNADQTRVINTVLAVPNYRIRPTGNSRFLFWETPPGSTQALRAWFYPGDNFGQEFTYPKHLRQLAMATPAYEAPTASPIEEAPAPAPARAVANEETPAPGPVAAVEESPAPAPSTQPAVEDNAPAAPPQDANPSATSSQLPKTATPAPIMGFGGLLAFGVYSLLRLKRA